MSEHSHDFKAPEDVDVPPSSLWAKWYLFLGLGAIGLIGTFATWGTNRDYLAHSYLFAYATWLSVALGCLCFVLIQHVVRAGWSVSVRRIAENGMKTLWVFALLFIPIVALSHDLFPWTHEDHIDAILEKKLPYLNLPFFYVRAAVYFIAWVGLSFILYKKSVEMDAGGDVEKPTRFLWKLSAGGLFIFGLTLTFAAFDWLMSLQPHWYSTMWGVYYFAGAMLGAYAFMTLVAMSLQRGGLLKTAITTEHYHDLGKFLFGHTIFWAYVAFSQFMLIWYANIPEETEFYYHRVLEEHGWYVISYLLPITNFFVPFFFLLSRHVKRNRFALAVAAVYIFLVHAVDLYWVVLPTAEGGHTHFPSPKMWIDVCAFVGVGGIFLAAFAYYLSKHKVLAVGDPRLAESMAHENY